MAVGWKLVVDCADPHRLAAFWAVALEYVVEDHSRLIEQLLGVGAIDGSVYEEREGRKVFREFAAVRHPDDPYDEQRDIGLERRLLFQRVPEAAAAGAAARPKNPLHIDVHAGEARRAETVRRLVGLGATYLHDVKEPQGEWSVLEDPEGNIFCVA